MQGAQLAEMEALYKEEQVLRKRYFNMIEGLFTITSILNEFFCIHIESFENFCAKVPWVGLVIDTTCER